MLRSTSAVPVRVLTSGGVALALALATPTAALAGPADDERSHGAGSEQERRSDSSRSAQGGSGSSGSQGGNSQAGSRTSGSHADNSERAGSSGSKTQRSKGRSGEVQKGGTDPNGNNGTVKVDGAPFDDGRGNDPHVGCVFEIDFYGFDAGDTADITLTGQAPTGGGLLWSANDRLISTDAAGGGQDVDASIRLAVPTDLSLAGIAPHPQQGWHVKLAVDVEGAPGGAKQKVFWIDCPAPAGAGTAESGAAEGGAEGGGSATEQTATVSGATVAATLGAGTAEVLTGTTVAAVQQQEQLLAAQGTRRTAQTTLGSGEAAATVRGSRLPSTLPFTGTEGLLGLLALGLSAVGVGAVAHGLGRKAAAADIA